MSKYLEESYDAALKENSELIEQNKKLLQRLERYENALQQIKYDYEQSLDHDIAIKNMYREAIAALKE